MADQHPDATTASQQTPPPPRPQEQKRTQPPGRGQHPQGRGAPQRQGPQQGPPVDISVVIPLYNEEDSLRDLHQQLRGVLGRMNARYEVLYIDDGSTDRSFHILRDLKRNDRRVKVIRFRRNYGKSAALSVGFEKAQGNIVYTMDADLQDDPAELPGLRKRLEEGFDLVSGWKKRRRDPITKTIPSRFFNFITRLMTGIRIHDFNCGLKVYRREVVKTVKIYGELHRYVPVLAHWEGFRIGEHVVQHRPRRYGKSKFGIGRFWKGFLDLLTALFTTRYLRRPLHLFGFWGMCSALAGLGIVVWLSVEKIMVGTALSNRPLFLGGILLLIVGIQFISIGLLGEMISRTRTSDVEYSIRDYLK